MTYTGKIHNGAVVLDTPIALPEGSKVERVVIPLPELRVQPGDAAKGRFEDLMPFAGQAAELPEDASTQLDHYLYGLPKQ